jgi:hypothetical protein
VVEGRRMEMGEVGGESRRMGLSILLGLSVVEGEEGASSCSSARS